MHHASIAPLPTPEEAVAIVAALHRHRRRRPVATSEPSSGWLRAARREALRPDWAARRGDGWRRATR
jgi:hypothetical protein